MLGEGTYPGKAVSWGMGETSTGKEQVAIEFETFDSEGLPGAHITWFGFFTDAALETTIKALRACGWKGDDLATLDGLDTNLVDLVIEHEEYEGKKQARVRWVNAPGSGGLALRTPLSDEKLRRFSAAMRAKISSLSGGGPRPAGAKNTPRPNQRKAPEPPPHRDEDGPPF